MFGQKPKRTSIDVIGKALEAFTNAQHHLAEGIT